MPLTNSERFVLCKRQEELDKQLRFEVFGNRNKNTALIDKTRDELHKITLKLMKDVEETLSKDSAGN